MSQYKKISVMTVELVRPENGSVIWAFEDTMKERYARALYDALIRGENMLEYPGNKSSSAARPICVNLVAWDQNPSYHDDATGLIIEQYSFGDD